MFDEMEREREKRGGLFTAVFGDLRRLWTAYHEAGHVVAALSLGFDVHQTSIARNGNILGVTQFAPGVTRRLAAGFDSGVFTRALRETAERYLTVVLAGPAAQKRFTGRDNPQGASRDYDVVNDLILRLHRDHVEAAEKFDLLRYYAQSLIEADWSRVTRYATALHDESTLNAERILVLYQPQAALD